MNWPTEPLQRSPLANKLLRTEAAWNLSLETDDDF